MSYVQPLSILSNAMQYNTQCRGFEELFHLLQEDMTKQSHPPSSSLYQ